MAGPLPSAGLLRQFGRRFLLLWGAEMVLATGSAITEFALHAWVYTRSGSLLRYSLVIAVGALTTILVLPIAGLLADRLDRRTLILSADASIALSVAALAWLTLKGGLMVWHVYLFTIAIAAAGGFRGPAYRAALSAFLSNGNYSRAGGLLSISVGVSGLVVPLMASGTLKNYDLAGVMAIEMAAVGVSSALIWMGFLGASPALAKAPGRASIRQRWAGILAGWSEAIEFFRRHAAMRLLFAYSVVQGCFTALTASLITPLILANYSLHELAVIMTFGGVGALLGGLPLFIPAVARRLAVSMLVADALLAVFMIGAGFAHTIAAYALCAFFAMFAGAAAAGSADAIWMQKAPLRRQGSIFALHQALALISAAAATLLAGALVDVVLTPALSPGGAMTQLAKLFPAARKGQGISLLFIACGVLGLAISLRGLAHDSMRFLDRTVPDGRDSPASSADSGLPT